MGETEESVEQDSGKLNRRRLLQGAAAAGIGAAVWTVPSITSLGGTPAYADMCTKGYDTYELGTSNTSCNCQSDLETKLTGQLPKAANYPPVTGVRCNTTWPTFTQGTWTLREGSCTGTEVGGPGNPSACPTGYAGVGEVGVGICLTGLPQDLYCRTEVRVYTNGACGPYTKYLGSIAQGGFSELPPILCQGGGSIFYSVLLNCTTERECL